MSKKLTLFDPELGEEVELDCFYAELMTQHIHRLDLPKLHRWLLMHVRDCTIARKRWEDRISSRQFQAKADISKPTRLKIVPDLVRMGLLNVREGDPHAENPRDRFTAYSFGRLLVMEVYRKWSDARTEIVYGDG